MLAMSVVTLPFGRLIFGVTDDVVRMGMPPCTVVRIR